MPAGIRAFRPWLLAIAAIALVEAIYGTWAHPPRIARNSFLDLRFADADSFQRLVAYEKIIAFEDFDPDVIQVGDSSGLHGVQPPVVMSHIPGYRYLNLSVATNLGYPGYYNLAKLQLERSPNARYLVLYVSPLGGLPRRKLWDSEEPLMAPLIGNEFLSWPRRLFQTPTLAARRDVTNYVYYMGHRFSQPDAPLSTNRGYLAFKSVFRESNGWVRETDVEGDVPKNIYAAILPGIDPSKTPDADTIRGALRTSPKVTDERFFDWRTLSYEHYFDHVYGAFAELAREHGVKLVVIFNPMPESSRGPGFDEFINWGAIDAGIKRVRDKYPEVAFGSIDMWPDEKFSVFSHIGALSSDENSHRVGRILKAITGGSPPEGGERRPGAGPRPPGPVAVDFDRPYCGYGWTDSAGATNGFPLQYVGALGKAWVWMGVGPGSAYAVRGLIRGNEPGVAERVELKANGIRMRRVGVGKDGSGQYAEFQVPEAVASQYGGWMSLEFDFGDAVLQDAQGRRAVSFRRVSASPVAVR